MTRHARQQSVTRQVFIIKTTAFGRKRPFNSLVLEVSERPLSGKADVYGLS